MAFFALGQAWAADATMTAGTNGSICTVNNIDGVKVGTSKKGGDMTITVGAGAKKMTFYAAAWSGVTGLKLNITPKDNVATASIDLTADAGLTGNSPFTLDGNEDSYKFEIELKNITAETELTLTSSTTKRFVVWGATYEAVTCSSEVDITKGAEENGTFTLSDSKVCADGDGGTITVSDITPAAGYMFDKITTSASGTVDNDKMEVSGITAATTISVVFKELPKYIVTWNCNGVETTSQVYEGFQPTFPATPAAFDATSTTFIGWAAESWTGKLGNINDKKVYLAEDELPVVKGAVTYYAVFAKKEGSADFDGTEGGQYYIGANVDGTMYYAKNFAKKFDGTTELSEAFAFTFEKIEDKGDIYFAIKDGSYYLSYGTSGTDFTTNSKSQYKWTVEAGKNGTWRVNATSGTNRAIIYRAVSQNVFGAYSTGNANSTSTEYYDIEIIGGSITTDYMTTYTEVKKYAITIVEPDPAKGKLEVADEDLNPIASGDTFDEGALIVVEATPATGFKDGEIKIIKTGVDPEEDVTAKVMESGIITMPAYDITISVTFASKSATACEDVEATEKAAKVLKNGQLIIVREGKTYNVLGATLK